MSKMDIIREIKRDLDGKADYITFKYTTVKEIYDLLKEQEAKVEVVRCKNCKYCVKEPNGELFCDILAVGYEPLGSKKVNEDWFCADGEIKGIK